MAGKPKAKGETPATTKKPGRPPGAPPKPPQNDVPASRCPVCQSTDREDYGRVQRVPATGPAPDGSPCTEIVLRRTRCAACGQHRIDRTYENRAA